MPIVTVVILPALTGFSDSVIVIFCGLRAEKAIFVMFETLPTLTFNVAIPESVDVRNTRPYPEALVKIEAEFKVPKFVMKFTAILLKGVEFSVTLTTTLTLSPALFWTCSGSTSIVKAIADILNERSISARSINFV
jgi:hypothetical protein